MWWSQEIRNLRKIIFTATKYKTRSTFSFYVNRKMRFVLCCVKKCFWLRIIILAGYHGIIDGGIGGTTAWWKITGNSIVWDSSRWRNFQLTPFFKNQQKWQFFVRNFQSTPKIDFLSEICWLLGLHFSFSDYIFLCAHRKKKQKIFSRRSKSRSFHFSRVY